MQVLTETVLKYQAGVAPVWINIEQFDYVWMLESQISQLAFTRPQLSEHSHLIL